VLEAYDEPEAEPDVSATSSSATRLPERLNAALLMLRGASAGDRMGACRLRLTRSLLALRLAMQDLPRGSMRIGQEPCVSAHANCAPCTQQSALFNLNEHLAMWSTRLNVCRG